METEKSNPSKVYILYGKTRSAKTSFLKHLANDRSLLVGEYGTGVSTTKGVKPVVFTHSSLLNGIQICILDTIGYDDSDECFSDQDILDLIETEILKYSNLSQIDGILVTDSMMGDTITIKNSLKRLNTLFGDKVADSVVVLATKANEIDDSKKMMTKLGQIEADAKSMNIKGGVINFITPYSELNISEISQWGDQLKALDSCLRKLTPLSLDFMKSKKSYLTTKAQEIQKKKTVPRTVSKIVPETILVNETRYQSVPITHTKRRGGLAGAFGGTKSWTEWVQQPYIVQVPTVQNKTIYYTENDVPPLDLCMREAWMEFDKEVRSKIVKRNPKLIL